MPPSITRESPDTPDARALIAELDAHLGARYAAESRHGYSVDKLLREGVEFFVIRQDAAPVGCGGVQFFPADASTAPYAELKRMYVRPAFQGLGFGKLMLEHLEQHVRARGVTLLRLETGIHQHAAIGLYESFGFQRVGPFGSYRPDPNSAFFEKPVRPS